MNSFRKWTSLGVALLCANNLSAQPRLTSNLQSRPLYQSLQESLDSLSRLEIVREEATLLRRPAAELDPLRDQCRQIIKQLKDLDNRLQQLLRQSYQLRPSQRDPDSWDVPELESLARNLQIQLARAYRNQALCYADDSDDRFNSVNLAVEHLTPVLSQPIDEASVWQARVEQVVCLRHASKRDEARAQIDRWLQASPPASVGSRLAGERLLLLLDGGEVDRALLVLGEMPRPDATTPEADEAILDTLLAGGRTRDAVEQLERLAAAHGPYWRRRAELRIGFAVASPLATNDPALLNFAAVSLYAAGRKQEAMAAYDRIAELTTDHPNQEQRFQALRSAAAIAEEVDQPLAALKRSRDLTLEYPRHAEAPDLHLTAIRMAVQRMRAATADDRGRRFEQYVALLEEHLQRWPDSSMAPQVKQWLTRSQQSEIEQQRADALVSLGNRQEAIELYRKQSHSHPTNGQLHETFATLLEQGDAEAELREAVQVWRQVEQRSKPGGPRWWRGRRARIALLKRLGEEAQAEKLKQLAEILYPDAQ